MWMRRCEYWCSDCWIEVVRNRFPVSRHADRVSFAVVIRVGSVTYGHQAQLQSCAFTSMLSGFEISLFWTLRCAVALLGVRRGRILVWMYVWCEISGIELY